jgi:hypothetical protein
LNLQQLDLEDCQIDSEGVKHVASLLRRPNSPLRVLNVTSRDGGGLEPADCQVLCESVPHSPNLRSLSLCVKQVRADTLSGVAASSSPLRSLYVIGAYTEEGVTALTRQLRTNTRMAEVGLSETDSDSDGHACVRPFLPLLETYNFTLRKARVAHSARGEVVGLDVLTPLLRRNRAIRHGIRRLKPREYRVAPVGVWPRAFEKVGAFPTLLYRLVRRGNVDALCDVVARMSSLRERGAAVRPDASKTKSQ